MDTNADETTPSRGFYSSARGAGAGGKLKRPPSRKPPTSPYSRPPTNQAERGKRRWISSVVDPAYRLISGGATRLFTSFFSPASSANALPSPDVQRRDDEQDAEIEQNADAEERNGDLNILTGHQDNAEFALAMCPTEPYVLSGGKDKTVVLLSIQDHIAASTTDPAKSLGSGGSIIRPGDGNEKAADGPSVAPRGVYQGHEDTVGDVAFCSTSSQEFCSVGDDSCLILSDACVGSSPAVKNLVSRTETAGPSRVGNSSNDGPDFQGHIVDDDTNSSHESGLSDIEQLLKGKKFSRDEVNRLLEIIQSNAVEHLSMGHRKEKLSSTSGGEAKGPVITHAVPKAVSGEIREDTSKAIWGTSTPLPQPAQVSPLQGGGDDKAQRTSTPFKHLQTPVYGQTSGKPRGDVLDGGYGSSVGPIRRTRRKVYTQTPPRRSPYVHSSSIGTPSVVNFLPHSAHLDRRWLSGNITIDDDLLLLASDSVPQSGATAGDKFPLASATSSSIPRPPHLAINIEEEREEEPPAAQDHAIVPPPPARESFMRALWEELKKMEHLGLILPEAIVMFSQWLPTGDFADYMSTESSVTNAIEFVMNPVHLSIFLAVCLAILIPLGIIRRGQINNYSTVTFLSVFPLQLFVELTALFVNGAFASILNGTSIGKLKLFLVRAVLAYFVRVAKKLVTRYFT